MTSLREECSNLRKENESFKSKGELWTKKAKEMDDILKNLKSELDAKEKAIKKYADLMPAICSFMLILFSIMLTFLIFASDDSFSGL